MSARLPRGRRALLRKRSAPAVWQARIAVHMQRHLLAACFEVTFRPLVRLRRKTEVPDYFFALRAGVYNAH